MNRTVFRPILGFLSACLLFCALLGAPATAADGGSLLAVHPEAAGDYLEGTALQLALVEEWNEAMERGRQASADADRAAVRLKEEIGDAAGLEFPEGRLTWSRRPGSRLDARALRAAEPDVYERYRRETVNQRLHWKEA